MPVKTRKKNQKDIPGDIIVNVKKGLPEPTNASYSDGSTTMGEGEEESIEEEQSDDDISERDIKPRNKRKAKKSSAKQPWKKQTKEELHNELRKCDEYFEKLEKKAVILQDKYDKAKDHIQKLFDKASKSDSLKSELALVKKLHKDQILSLEAKHKHNKATEHAELLRQKDNLQMRLDLIKEAKDDLRRQLDDERKKNIEYQKHEMAMNNRKDTLRVVEEKQKLK